MRGIVAKTTAVRKVFEGVRPDPCAKDGKARAPAMPGVRSTLA